MAGAHCARVGPVARVLAARPARALGLAVLAPPTIGAVASPGVGVADAAAAAEEGHWLRVGAHGVPVHVHCATALAARVDRRALLVFLPHALGGTGARCLQIGDVVIARASAKAPRAADRADALVTRWLEGAARALVLLDDGPDLLARQKLARVDYALPVAPRAVPLPGPRAALPARLELGAMSLARVGAHLDAARELVCRDIDLELQPPGGRHVVAHLEAVNGTHVRVLDVQAEARGRHPPEHQAVRGVFCPLPPEAALACHGVPRRAVVCAVLGEPEAAPGGEQRGAAGVVRVKHVDLEGGVGAAKVGRTDLHRQSAPLDDARVGPVVGHDQVGAVLVVLHEVHALLARLLEPRVAGPLVRRVIRVEQLTSGHRVAPLEGVLARARDRAKVGKVARGGDAVVEGLARVNAPPAEVALYDAVAGGEVGHRLDHDLAGLERVRHPAQGPDGAQGLHFHVAGGDVARLVDPPAGVRAAEVDHAGGEGHRVAPRPRWIIVGVPAVVFLQLRECRGREAVRVGRLGVPALALEAAGRVGDGPRIVLPGAVHARGGAGTKGIPEVPGGAGVAGRARVALPAQALPIAGARAVAVARRVRVAVRRAVGAVPVVVAHAGVDHAQAVAVPAAGGRAGAAAGLAVAPEVVELAYLACQVLWAVAFK
mmetsp:Transcript_1108/g.4485  ORF Transcript_1108/g.4485 Transcript_1108/m.4485 type:complete len:658 (+) Transcript_1108:2031-4004(+)